MADGHKQVMHKIKEHGNWELYKPDPWPEGMPAFALFNRRKSDGKDWYEFVRGDEFEADTVKMTVYDMGTFLQVQAVTREIDRLCPQGSLVLEVWGIDDADPQETYGYGKLQYLRESSSFEPLAPLQVSHRQFYMQLANKGVISEDEALAAMAGTIPKELLDGVALLPKNQQFAAKMMLVGQMFDRTDPNFIAVASAMGMSQGEVDNLFTAAVLL